MVFFFLFFDENKGPVDLSDVCTINVEVTLLTVQLLSLMNGYATINNTLTASQKKKN